MATMLARFIWVLESLKSPIKQFKHAAFTPMQLTSITLKNGRKQNQIYLLEFRMHQDLKFSKTNKWICFLYSNYHTGSAPRNDNLTYFKFKSAFPIKFIQYFFSKLVLAVLHLSKVFLIGSSPRKIDSSSIPWSSLAKNPMPNT
jgi:hypothetical protein